MARLKQTDNYQGQFMAVNLKEQLLSDMFEWTINYLFNKTDMSLFEEKYNNDESVLASLCRELGIYLEFSTYIHYCYNNK